jgi:uncharacterized protein YneF (UPF0154 family)
MDVLMIVVCFMSGMIIGAFGTLWAFYWKCNRS